MSNISHIQSLKILDLFNKLVYLQKFSFIFISLNFNFNDISLNRILFLGFEY